MAAGKNVGVRLRDIDLVVDVDPRNFAAGDDPLARLSIDFGLPDAPFVLTGGGGRHLYFRKTANVEIRGKLADYGGIEFKSKVGQVVAAGSIHPDTARPYRLDDDALAMSLSEAPEAPTAFLDALGRPSKVASGDVGAIDEEKLAEWLSHVDVAKFREELRWRELMMSCHHATRGSGVEVFIDWSTADFEYADHGEIIRRRWNSLVVKPGAITARTLIAALPKAMRRERLHAKRGRCRLREGRGAGREVRARSGLVPVAAEAFDDVRLGDISAEAFEAATGRRIEPWTRHRQARRATDRRASGLDLSARRRGGQCPHRGRDCQREVRQVVREQDAQAGH